MSIPILLLAGFWRQNSNFVESKVVVMVYVSSGKCGKRKTRNRKNSKHEIDLSSMLFQKSISTALDISRFYSRHYFLFHKNLLKIALDI